MKFRVDLGLIFSHYKSTAKDDDNTVNRQYKKPKAKINKLRHWVDYWLDIHNGYATGILD